MNEDICPLCKNILDKDKRCALCSYIVIEKQEEEKMEKDNTSFWMEKAFELLEKKVADLEKQIKKDEQMEMKKDQALNAALLQSEMLVEIVLEAGVVKEEDLPMYAERVRSRILQEQKQEHGE